MISSSHHTRKISSVGVYGKSVRRNSSSLLVFSVRYFFLLGCSFDNIHIRRSRPLPLSLRSRGLRWTEPMSLSGPTLLTSVSLRYWSRPVISPELERRVALSSSVRSTFVKQVQWLPPIDLRLKCNFTKRQNRSENRRPLLSSAIINNSGRIIRLENRCTRTNSEKNRRDLQY